MTRRTRRPSYSDLFDQTKVWVDGTGKEHRIRDMGEDHLSNLVKYLLRHASGYHLGYGLEFASFPVSGEQASYDLDAAVGQFAQIEPEKWMRSTPLFKALKRRLVALRVPEVH